MHMYLYTFAYHNILVFQMCPFFQNNCSCQSIFTVRALVSSFFILINKRLTFKVKDKQIPVFLTYLLRVLSVTKCFGLFDQKFSETTVSLQLCHSRLRPTKPIQLLFLKQPALIWADANIRVIDWLRFWLQLLSGVSFHRILDWRLGEKKKPLKNSRTKDVRCSLLF